MEHLVAYFLHPSYKRAKFSQDQLIIVTDSVTLGVSSQFLPRRKVFFPVKTHFFPLEGKKYLSSGKKPNPGGNSAAGSSNIVGLFLILRDWREVSSSVRPSAAPPSPVPGRPTPLLASTPTIDLHQPVERIERKILYDEIGNLRREKKDIVVERDILLASRLNSCVIQNDDVNFTQDYPVKYS